MAKEKEPPSVPERLLRLLDLVDVFLAEINALLPTCKENEADFLELNRKTWALKGVYFTALQLMSEKDFDAFIKLTGGDKQMILESIKDFDITKLSFPNPGN